MADESLPSKKKGISSHTKNLSGNCHTIRVNQFLNAQRKIQPRRLFHLLALNKIILYVLCFKSMNIGAVLLHKKKPQFYFENINLVRINGPVCNL